MAVLHFFTALRLQAAMLGAAFIARLPCLADGRLLFPNLMLALQDSTYKYFEIVMVDPHHKCVRKVGAIAGLQLFGKGIGCNSMLDFASQLDASCCCQRQRPKLPMSFDCCRTRASTGSQTLCTSIGSCAALPALARSTGVSGTGATPPTSSGPVAEPPGSATILSVSSDTDRQGPLEACCLCAVSFLHSLLS